MLNSTHRFGSIQWIIDYENRSRQNSQPALAADSFARTKILHKKQHKLRLLEGGKCHHKAIF